MGDWGTAQIPASKRESAKAMLPTTWKGRPLKVEYVVAGDEERRASGMFLDSCGTGLILNAAGGRTCIAWSALRLVELAE